MNAARFVTIAGIGGVLARRNSSVLPSPSMGDPVDIVRAPNGAITSRKPLDRAGDFSWIKPTIEEPTKEIRDLGGSGLAPMSIVEAEVKGRATAAANRIDLFDRYRPEKTVNVSPAHPGHAR